MLSTELVCWLGSKTEWVGKSLTGVKIFAGEGGKIEKLVELDVETILAGCCCCWLAWFDN